MQSKPFVTTSIVTLALLSLTMALTTTEPSTTTTRLSTTEKPTEKVTTPTTTSTTATSTTTTGTPPPTTSTEWQDMEETESQKLVNFVVSEIQKLKVEHKELDDCQELNLSSVLSGKKLVSDFFLLIVILSYLNYENFKDNVEKYFVQHFNYNLYH
ncbi:hypothetical protein TNCT_499691 [Trichonephila clavata]|uniref:Uncharacterized protein n=1 Tax=Trichonephila clavata TaxID=2740835 RepID=A0A8X6IRM3_TRICU|nr:hypothetical protein TNCT_499691 [Trichonephila clavata]